MSKVRVDADGTAWQRCPRCDLRVIASGNGWREHDPHCNGAFQPYMTMLAERGIGPFERNPGINPATGERDPRVQGTLLPLRWRVAPDQWQRLSSWVRAQAHLSPPAAAGLPSTLFGWPIEPDLELTAGSILLESAEPYGVR